MKLTHALFIGALALGACGKKPAEPVKTPEPTKETKVPTKEADPTKPLEADTVAAAEEVAVAAPEEVAVAAAEEVAAAPAEEVAVAAAEEVAVAAAEEVAAAPADDPPRVADFPDTALTAEVGQWVFAPTRASLDEAKKDPEYHSPSYQQMKVVEIGPTVSKLAADFGDPESIPNAYVIPIPKDEAVAVGDVVLSAKYGNNMELAIVTEVGPPAKADFVEIMPYDEDHLADLKPGRYLKLDGTLKPGAHAMVKQGAEKKYGYVVNIVGDKVLLAGHMGSVMLAPKADVTPLEVTLDVAVGDAVGARFASGTMMKAKVTKVDKKARVFWVDYDDLPDPEPSPHPPVHLTKQAL